MNDAFLEKLILDIDNGNWNNYITMFNDNFGLFLSLIDHNDLLEDLYPFEETLNEYRNKIYLYLLNKDKDKWLKIIGNEIFGLKYNEGVFFEEFRDEDEICEFFEDDRFAREIISGDFFYEYDYTPDVPVSYLLNELTKENKKIFYNYLFNILNGKLIESIPDDYDDEDGTFTITSENFPLIFDDENTLNIIVEEELPDVYDTIKDIIRWANQNAGEDGCHNAFWSALKPYYFNPKYGEKDNITLEVNDFYGEIVRFLRDPYNNDIGYYEHNYFDLVKDNNYKLKIYIDDYYDDREYINSYFIENFT